jgi:ATP-dependent Lhr-like helicase
VLFEQLVAADRAFDAQGFWIAVERFDELNAVAPQAAAPAIPERLRKSWTPEDAARELVRGRMEVLGPMTARGLADSLGLRETALVDGALLALEVEGKVLRGRFTPGAPALEWCDRRLLARIHRYTLNRLRAEIEPVSAADFMRFLLHWQHVADETRLKGAEGLAAAIEQLDGFELPAGAWEQDVLAARVQDYEPGFIDRLCLSGRMAWGRITPASGSSKAPLRSSPIALMPREHAGLWRAPAEAKAGELSSDAVAVHEALRAHGASFFHEIVAATRLLRAQVERALGELAGAGLVTADSFSGLRALLAPTEKHRKRSRRRGSDVGVDAAGRWALLQGGSTAAADARAEQVARALLSRYGVVFRALLAREPRLPTWRELAAVYRRLEARGEIRGGRFVSGFGGEQFALAEAVGRLRALRRQDKNGEFIALSAADPLNLVGIVTPEARVAAITPNRVLFRDGLAIAALEAGQVRRLAASEHDDATLKSLFWPRSRAAGPDLRPLSQAARKRWLERRLRIPLPG